MDGGHARCPRATLRIRGRLKKGKKGFALVVARRRRRSFLFFELLAFEWVGVGRWQMCG